MPGSQVAQIMFAGPPLIAPDPAQVGDDVIGRYDGLDGSNDLVAQGDKLR